MTVLPRELTHSSESNYLACPGTGLSTRQGKLKIKRLIAVKLTTLKPFRESPEARRLALVFAIVYFAQGMWYLPNLSITFLLKDAFGLSAAQTATFFSITVIPWLIKPVYGVISDFLPLFGQRRRSYFILSSGLAAAMGLTLTIMVPIRIGEWLFFLL